MGRAATKFAEFINEMKLVDLPLIDSKFTWSNNREELTFRKLDCFLVTTNLLAAKENLIQKCLRISISNYNPICLRAGMVD
ncbi:Uncharacterized protein TCM_036316 [Theobroma cacao]|uniref:Uncharacterized protein n=1 Tax=Theobroma cacao TaxID=3641 RepID=A0A061FIL2_THECC|nr:Uncharacterized protein TCM_036316 [Theobroma cacao]